VRRSLLRGDSDVIGRAGNAVRLRSSEISLVLRRLRAPCTPHNKQASMDLAISWRMKRLAYAPTTASSSPSSNRCKTHCRSWNATRRRKTFPYAYPASRVRRSLLRSGVYNCATIWRTTNGEWRAVFHTTIRGGIEAVRVIVLVDVRYKYRFCSCGKPGLNVACALTDPVATNTEVI